MVDAVAERAGRDGWGIRDDGWEELESLVREARIAKLTSHDLFASVVMNEPRVSEALPWPVRHLFKLPRLAQNYLWHDADHHVWVEGGANGVLRLKDYITRIFQGRFFLSTTLSQTNETRTPNCTTEEKLRKWTHDDKTS